MLANRAMNSPMWRARESRRNLRDDADLAKAASDHAIATKERASAQMMVDICHDKIIWLDPRAPRVRKKFKRLIALARRQIQLQGDHEGGAINPHEQVFRAGQHKPISGSAGRVMFNPEVDRLNLYLTKLNGPYGATNFNFIRNQDHRILQNIEKEKTSRIMWPGASKHAASYLDHLHC